MSASQPLYEQQSDGGNVKREKSLRVNYLFKYFFLFVMIINTESSISHYLYLHPFCFKLMPRSEKLYDIFGRLYDSF